MTVALVGIFARLTVLQVSQAGALRDRGAAWRMQTVELPAERGQILDRNGSRLAISMPAVDLYVDPRYVTDAWGAAVQLAPLLGMEMSEVLAGLTAPDRTFVYLARQVEPAVADRVRALHLPGIGFLPSTRREYPAGPLAGQVLGFVGLDGQGLAGLELHYEHLLAGRAGERTQELDPYGQPIVGGVRRGCGARPGGVAADDDRPGPPVPGTDRARGGRHGAVGTRRDRDRDGSGDRRHPRHGELPMVRPERVRGGRALDDPQQGGDRRVRARFHQQGDHRGRRGPGGGARAGSAALGAMEDAGGRVRDPRLAPPPRDADDARRRDRRVQQHRNRAGGRPRRRADARVVHVAVRPRACDRRRVPGRGRWHHATAVRVDGREPRDDGVRPGDHVHTGADGRRVRHDRERRPLGPAPSGPWDRRSGRRVPRRRAVGEPPGGLGRERRDGDPDARVSPWITGPA